MALHITVHDSIYLFAIIEEGHTAFPIDLNLGYILTLYQCWKGSGFKKGVCLYSPTPGAPLPWLPLAWSLSLEGPRLPSLVSFPPCGFKATSLPMPLPKSSCRWSAPNCYNDNNASPPSGCLSWPSQGTPWIPLWPSQFHFFILLCTLLFQVHQVYSWHFNCWLGPLELPQGEETSHPWFGSVISCLAFWALG